MVIAARAHTDDVSKHLRTVAKQFPFASSVALNETAKDIQRAEAEATDEYFDRPTPFTRRAFRVERSTKRRLRSAVYIAPAQLEYLRFQIQGGIQTRGRDIPVPLRRRPNMRLNQYGNLPRRSISRLLRKPNVFVGTINGVEGIYQRGRRTKRNPRPGVKLLVALETQTQYRPRFPFYAIAKKTYDKRWPVNFDAALDKALRTARF